MKLRQARKILKRIYEESFRNQMYGTPLPKSWRRLLCAWHRANAVNNHHNGPIGRAANKWANDYLGKISKNSRKK